MKRLREPEEEDSSADGESRNLEPTAKFVDLDSDLVADEPAVAAMICSMPPHKEPLTFKSYDEYEAHYNKAHLNRCLECGRNLPSAHLLNVHIEECHDAFAVVKRERGEHTYSCFVEGCERKCMTPQKRRLHLIDKHMYPKNFFFAVTKEGIDGRRSLLLEGGHHRRRSSTGFQARESRRRASLMGAADGPSPPKPTSSPKDSHQPAETSPVEKRDGSSGKAEEDEEMEGLAGAMSALQFVPSNIRFGRGGSRTGFSRR